MSANLKKKTYEQGDKTCKDYYFVTKNNYLREL